MRPRCRVCGSRRCETPLERERAARVEDGRMLAGLLLERFRAGRVLAAAERYERAAVAFEALRPGDSAEALLLEQDASTAALLAAVRARRGAL